jgi:Uma2 family endonuclease
MAKPAKKLATYDDLLAVPDHLIAEILDGELITTSRPAIAHAGVTSVLGMDLGSPFQRGRGGPGGWVILDEPELHLGADILVPDLAAWRVANFSGAGGAFITRAPDWVCEVLSPGTQRIDRVRKMPIYAREGVGHVWLVDPLAQTLEVYRRGEPLWALVASFGGDMVVRAEPFDAIELDLGSIWFVEP